MAEEREDLQALVDSPGWARVQRYIAESWEDRRLTAVFDQLLDEDSPRAVEQAKQLAAICRAFRELRQWINHRIRVTTEATPVVPSPSRRGPL